RDRLHGGARVRALPRRARRVGSAAVGSDAEVLATVNALPGWARDMGIMVTAASADEVVAEIEIGPRHHQAYGIVHGGVHCGIIETLASIGAALVAMPGGQRVVGLENATSFVRAVREGRLV